MVKSNVDRVLQEVVALTKDEREQLLSRLGITQLHKEAPTIEHLVKAALLKKGIIVAIPPDPTPEQIAAFAAWKPLSFEGRPVSETLIEERR